MLTIFYPLDALLMIGMPLVLGVWLARKTKAPWLLFGIGAMTFIGSQVVHLPLNTGLTLLFKAIWPSTQPQGWHIPFNAVVLGLTAGLCEETARYVGYRWLAKKARYWRDALMLGAGHGGIEAILVVHPRQPVGDGFAGVHPAQRGLACCGNRLSFAHGCSRGIRCVVRLATAGD